MSGEFGLKRVLGLPDLIAIEVGTTVGAGIFSLTALAAAKTGPSIPLAFAAAAVPMAFLMMTVGMLGAAMPTVGGSYRYPSRLFSPRFALVGVWSYALGAIIGGFPLYALECARYLKPLWPEVPVRAAAVGLVTFFYVVNLLGISVAARVQALMTVVMLSALLVFGFAGAPEVSVEDFQPLFTGGAGGFIVATAILTFALQGSNSVIELGAEIKRPKRNIPLSLAISIPLVTVIYILVAVSAVGSIDIKEWISFGADANLTQPAGAILGGKTGPFFLFFVIGGAIFAFTTTLNGTFMWATKSLMVVAHDGLIPESLAKTSRFGTPALFLTIIWVGSTVAIILDAGVAIFASYATLGGLLIFIPAMLSAIMLPKKAPEVYALPGFRLKGILIYLAPGVAVAIQALLIVVLLVDLLEKSWVYPVLFVVWFGLGFVFYEWRRRAVEKRTGRPFQAVIDEDLGSLVRESLAASKKKEV